jgi:glucokinase
MSKKIILSGDIGGSHITVGRFIENDSVFKLEDLKRESIDSYAPKSIILDQWVSIFTDLIHPNEDYLLTLAIPAPFDYKNGICLIEKQGKFRHLFGINLREELSGHLGILPSNIFFINDAEAFLLGEVSFGEGNNVNNILGLTLGSGLGSSIKSGNTVRDGGLWCSPFKSGIAEDYLSSRWFINWINQELNIQVDGVKEIVSNPEIMKKGPSVFDFFAKNLADFIIKQQEEFQADKIILGGNISKAYPFFLDKTLHYLQIQDLDIVIEVSQLGEKSAVFGALSATSLHQDLREKI